MGHNLQMSTWTVNAELEAEPFRKVNPDHLELRTEGVNEAASIWDAKSFLLWTGAWRGVVGGRSKGWKPTHQQVWRQGQMASYSQAWFSGQQCRVGGEQNSPAVSLKTMRRNRPWGGCLLGLLLAADPMPRLLGQEMSETPQRIV